MSPVDVVLEKEEQRHCERAFVAESRKVHVRVYERRNE